MYLIVFITPKFKECLLHAHQGNICSCGIFDTSEHGVMFHKKWLAKSFGMDVALALRSMWPSKK